MIAGGVVVLLAVFSYTFFLKTQQPEPADVQTSVEEWHSGPVDVLAVEKFDNQWVTFLKDQKNVYVGLLDQNVIGQWDVVDSIGNPGVIGNVPIQSGTDQENGIVWGASGLTKQDETVASYYYGVISNPEVDAISLSVTSGAYESISLIDSGGDRFFFIEKEGGSTVPFELQAKVDGNIIAVEG